MVPKCQTWIGQLSIPADRIGFTLIELLVVISIGVMLSAMALPAIMHSRERGLVNTATSILADLHSRAQVLARQTTDVAGGPWYSVRITQSSSGAVAEVISGTNVSNQTIMTRRIPGSFSVLTSNDPDGATLTPTDLQWWYTPRTGLPVMSYGSYTPISIGTPQQAAQPALNQITYGVPLPIIAQSPVASAFALASRSGQVRAVIAIYSCGLYNDHVFP